MPEDARCAGLTLIGWLARRMPGEDSSKDGVEHARQQLEDCGALLANHQQIASQQVTSQRVTSQQARGGSTTTISGASVSVTATNGMRRARAFVETTRVSRQVVVRLENRDSEEAPSVEGPDASRPSV